MLEITNIREGAVLNHHHGIETENHLEIKVEGLAAPQAKVTVNGIAAERQDRNFSALVRLTEKVNKITAVASDHFGERSLTLTVIWDKASFKRYNFFFDDCIFCLRWIALNRPASIFEEMFLKRLHSIHEKYGTRFTLNLFYRDDHHLDFTLSDFPEDYRAEFLQNSDWLRFSFHAESEFPDRPYQHADSETLAADYDKIYNEVCRFSGVECFIAPMVIHWAMTNPHNFHVLKERGVKCLAAGFLGSVVSVSEKTSPVDVTDIGFYYEQDVAHYLAKSAYVWYDREYDLILLKNLLCCNYEDIDQIRQKFGSLPLWRDTLNLMSHEQYSYPDYFNHIPDHLDRIEEACRLATENGYKPVWFSCGILGNTEWK